MQRLVLPEVEDSRGFPEFLRDAMTSYLQTVLETLNPYAVVRPAVEEILADADGCRVVDLASGGGGPWPTLSGELRERFPDLQVELTDAFPNRRAARRLEKLEGVRYRAEPLNLLASVDEPADLWTCFTALHHFDPGEVRQILREAQQARVPFVAAEATHRSLRGLVTALFIPILVWVMMPRVRPLRPLALLLTYFPPVLTLLIWWDGIASTLKSYSRREMESMAAEIAEPGYRWEVREMEVPRAPIPVLCIIGRPTQS